MFLVFCKVLGKINGGPGLNLQSLCTTLFIFTFLVIIEEVKKSQFFFFRWQNTDLEALGISTFYYILNLSTDIARALC